MTTKPATRNELLRSLSPQGFRAQLPSLDFVKLDLRQTLCEAGGKICHIYFPEDAIASVITEMVDGSMVEVGMTGIEGMVGFPVLLGSGISAHKIIVQVCGYAYRMRAMDCKKLFDRNASFREATLNYFETFLNLASQTAACNRLHCIEQRFARWLLMATDRLGRNTLPMTHEFLSAMLGARRAGITEIAKEFQQMGVIDYHRGQIELTDRKALEAKACECYTADHMQLRSLKNKSAKRTH